MYLHFSFRQFYCEKFQGSTMNEARFKRTGYLRMQAHSRTQLASLARILGLCTAFPECGGAGLCPVPALLRLSKIHFFFSSGVTRWTTHASSFLGWCTAPQLTPEGVFALQQVKGSSSSLSHAHLPAVCLMESCWLLEVRGHTSGLALGEAARKRR